MSCVHLADVQGEGEAVRLPPVPTLRGTLTNTPEPGVSSAGEAGCVPALSMRHPVDRASDNPHQSPIWACWSPNQIRRAQPPSLAGGSVPRICYLRPSALVSISPAFPASQDLLWAAPCPPRCQPGAALPGPPAFLHPPVPTLPFGLSLVAQSLPSSPGCVVSKPQTEIHKETHDLATLSDMWIYLYAKSQNVYFSNQC